MARPVGNGGTSDSAQVIAEVEARSFLDNPSEGAAPPTAPPGDLEDFMNRVGDGWPPSPPAPARNTNPDEAIRAGVCELMRNWTEAGYWRDSCDAGPGVTAVVTVALHFMRQLDKKTARGVSRYLVEQFPLEDGGFPAYPGGQESELSATAACYAALVVAEKLNPPDDAAIARRRKAKEFIDKQSLGTSKGVDAVAAMARGGDLGALTLALAGELPPSSLPDLPAIFGLAPGAEYLMAKRFAFLVPFRALVSEVLTAYLRANGPDGTPPKRAAGLGPLPRSTRELSNRLVSTLDAATQRATSTATSMTFSGAELVNGLMKDTARTAMGVAQGSLTAVAGAADSLRQGPMRFLEGVVRGAFETTHAVARGALGALGTMERLTPDVLAGGRRVVREVEDLRCQLYLHKYRNDDGSWLYGDAVHTALALAALYALGFPTTDTAMAESLTWLRRSPMLVSDKAGRDGLRFNVFYTDVWPTAFSLRALLNAGAAVSDPVISRAANWLIASQLRGSWAFQAANISTPDIDDTAVALAALAMVRDGLADLPAAPDGSLLKKQRELLHGRCVTSSQAARIWLMAQQNSDGGWAAYQPGLPGKQPGPMMTQPPAPPEEGSEAAVRLFLNAPAELGDPATEDVTGRVLFALGKEGVTVADRAVQHAIEFLVKQQDSSGGWWGRWVVNFVASTAWVLRGLVAVGADLKTPSVQGAIGFLRTRQRDDGGWSESVDTYRKPELARGKPDQQGASNPCLTGLVVSALVELGMADSDMATRGVEFLVKYQHDHAAWQMSGELTLHSLYPPNLFYTLPQTAYQLPVEGLGLYRKAHAPALRPGSTSVLRLPVLKDELSDDELREMRNIGDERADGVIAKILQSDKLIGGINSIFGTLASLADKPTHAQLKDFPGPVAEALQDYFGAIEKLDLDDRSLGLAQQLFVKAGFGVPLALFCSSLPQCYAFPDGARILMASGKFSADPKRRLVETAQLVFDVASPDGMRRASDEEVRLAVKAGRTPPGRGIRTIQKVRLMHAAIRHLAKTTGVWPKDETQPDDRQPQPVSQVEMLGTLLSFSVLVTDGLRALGFAVTDEEADAWFKLWRAVGKLLGLEDRKGLPTTAAGGARLFDRLRLMGWESSPQGTALARNTMSVMCGYLPGEEFDGVVATLVRHLAGDHCADLLEIEPSDWTRILVESSPVLETIMDRVVGETFFESALTPLLQQSAFKTMEALAGENREGKNVSFTIPTQLRNAWQNQFQGRFRPF